MQKGLIGKKVGMTQIFNEAGKVVPVTVLEAGPCVVVKKQDMENDGYESIQLGFGDMAEKKAVKPHAGQFKKAGVELKKVLKEFRLDSIADVNVGDVLKADLFAEGDRVDITGISKGKGFAGAIKRWNFGRQKETHGVGPVHRSVGSMGACSDPSRVMKGKKMAGHLGNEQVTIQNLDVIKVDVENNLLVVKGAVPGPKGGVVYVKNTVKNHG